MKCFEMSGTNGTLIELEDGRFSDTVSGYTSEEVSADDALEILRDECEEWVDTPFGDFNYKQMVEYTGESNITLKTTY